MKTKLGATDMFFPVPAALIGSGTFEKPNIITVASIGIVSSTPPTIGIALDKKRYSLEWIRASGSFTVNIPRAEHFMQTDYCGITSGKIEEKFSGASFTKLKADKISAPLIKECPFNLECRVTSEIVIGEYVLILAEILETHVDHAAITQVDGKTRIDIAKVNPLIYCATVREYWSIGTKLGDAFKAGKGLKNTKGVRGNE